MKSLIDLKKDIIDDKLETFYVFTGEEYMIKRIYYEKIAQKHGNLKRFDTVQGIYMELEKKSLFARKNVLICYNDLEYLKQKEKHYERLLKLSKNNIVILVYDTIPEKGPFRNVFEDYITQFNKVTDDIALKYVNKECKVAIGIDFAEKIAFNCDRSYGAIIEEMNKYNYYKESNPDHTIDAMTYACLFFDREPIPTPKEFANAFIIRDSRKLAKYMKLLKNENLLGYLPELYTTIIISLFIKIYGKWDGGTRAYESGEHWGRIKEIRDFSIPYTKDDLIDIRWLLYRLDLDLRKGRMKPEYAWDYLIGVIL